MRPYLVWISSGAAGPVSKIFDESREYDIAYHDYSMSPTVPGEAEYYWRLPGEKLNVAGKIFSDCELLKRYEAVAFLDDDLSFNVSDLNKAFRAGDALGLDIWQPSLTTFSHYSHPHLRQQTYWTGSTTIGFEHGVRRVPFVEIMMPFFSRRVLPDILSTLDINESGWGLDLYIWPKIAECYILDGTPFGHYQLPGRRDRVLRNGLTCQQELWIQQVIANPETAPCFPPGYQEKTYEYL